MSLLERFADKEVKAANERDEETAAKLRKLSPNELERAYEQALHYDCERVKEERE